MKPNAEQIEQIQTLLIDESAAVLFRKKGTKDEDGYWYLTNDRVSESGPIVDGDAKFYKDRSMDAFLTFIEENDPVAVVNLTGSNGGDEKFDDWDHLARYMGITELVVLSTKVPKRVAQKFQYYATQTTTVSEKLRSLVYTYVTEEIKDNAKEDMFR